MKTILLRICTFLAFAASASAVIIGVEQFDYPDGAIANQNGGTFWDFNNVSAVHTGTASDWDNVVNAPTVAGGMLITNSSSAKREYNGPGEGPPPSDEANGAVNDVNVNKADYYRVTVTTGATVPDFFGLSSYDFTNERVFIGKRFGISTFGASNNINGTFSDSSITVAPNTTYVLVGRVDYAANTIRLYVNPDFTAAEPATAAATVVYANTEWSTAVRLASGNTGSPVAWDNLVVATAWSDLGTVVTTATDEDNTSLDPAAGGGAGVSLREAVKYSPAGSLITFAPALSGKTCILSLGEMAIDRTLTIDASSLANGVTIDANNTSRHFFLNSSAASLTLKSLALINGNGVGSGSNVGGAILFATGNLFLQRCTLSGNFAGSAGAIQLQGSGTSRLEECTLIGNRATGSGGAGGIAILGGTCALSSCTISGNIGTGAGGGLYLQSPGSVSLSNCLIAGNTDSAANDIYKFSGTLTPSGSNLIGSNATVSTIFFQGPLAGTQGTPLNPKLSPLGYFGGPTQTMHPLIGSPAIDAGGTTNPGGTDQRGFARFIDGDSSGTAQLDIGAVEAGRLYTVGTPGDSGGDSLRFYLGFLASQPPGTRLGFVSGTFPANSVTLNGTELSISAALTGLFIDASNLSGPVTISGNNASRVFNIAAGATVAMHSLVIQNGKSPDGADGSNRRGLYAKASALTRSFLKPL